MRSLLLVVFCFCLIAPISGAGAGGRRAAHALGRAGSERLLGVPQHDAAGAAGGSRRPGGADARAEEAEYLAGRHAAIGRERDLQLNADWWQPGGLTNGRTSLIVDPPDGRLPVRTPAGRERASTLGIAIRLRSADGPEDRERYERCIMGRTVPLLAVSPNRLAQIFQTPDHVAILHEQNSDLRIIPLDGRPPLPAGLRQWQGSSRGRWEGDTLVVETAGFNGAWTIQGAGPNARYVERIRLAGADGLHYEFTAHDPESFAGPWTVTFPITRAAGPVFENACHEGNYSMPLILNGARAQERDRR